MDNKIKTLAFLSTIFLASCSETPKTTRYRSDSGIYIEFSDYNKSQGLDRFSILDQGKLTGHSNLDTMIRGDFCEATVHKAMFQYLTDQQIPTKADLECNHEH